MLCIGGDTHFEGLGIKPRSRFAGPGRNGHAQEACFGQLLMCRSFSPGLGTPKQRGPLIILFANPPRVGLLLGWRDISRFEFRIDPILWVLLGQAKTEATGGSSQVWALAPWASARAPGSPAPACCGPCCRGARSAGETRGAIHVFHWLVLVAPSHPVPELFGFFSCLVVVSV